MGAELASSWMGWNNLFHCEINPFGRKILDYYFKESQSYEDITKTDFREWRGKVDVLTGGFPCQPFSQAGKRKGNEDDRYLWPQMLRAISEIRPTWVVGENVAGIVSMVESCEEVEMGRTDDIFKENIIYRKEQEFTIERICKDFEREGYSVQPIVIPACSIGAPHRRDRVWFIAHRNSDGFIKCNCKNEKQSNKRGLNALDDIKQISTADTIYAGNTTQQNEVDTNEPEKMRRGEPQSEFARYVSERSTSDTKSEGLERQRGDKLQKPNGRFTNICGKYEKNKWNNFPTQSPVCCGNDGIPNRLDGITFPKWRAESIKAYGNAWVPQVAFEIFKAISNSSQ